MLEVLSLLGLRIHASVHLLTSIRALIMAIKQRRKYNEDFIKIQHCVYSTQDVEVLWNITSAVRKPLVHGIALFVTHRIRDTYTFAANNIRRRKYHHHFRRFQYVPILSLFLLNRP